jgi:hypothetical protein
MLTFNVHALYGVAPFSFDVHAFFGVTHLTDIVDSDEKTPDMGICV